MLSSTATGRRVSNGEITHVPRGSEIIAQDDKVEWCYRIVSGCVRTVRLIEDGRRQIGEFFLEGDIFGWDAMGVHDFSAQAVTGVRMRRARVHALEDRARDDQAFAQELRLRLADRIRITREHVVLLGRRTASERIASFLIDMRNRLPAGRDGAFALPMCRVDIADYLGLTIETVSRRLTKLDRSGVIGLSRGRIAIRDEKRLAIAACDDVEEPRPIAPQARLGSGCASGQAAQRLWGTQRARPESNIRSNGIV